MDIGVLIDSLYSLRQQRLELSKAVEAYKLQETALREQVLEQLDGLRLSKASGSLATCGVKETVEPYVEEWEKLFEYVRAENRFDLLHKRISAPAWRELRELGALVPGTSAITVRDVSLTKSSRG